MDFYYHLKKQKGESNMEVMHIIWIFMCSNIDFWCFDDANAIQSTINL